MRLALQISKKSFIEIPVKGESQEYQKLMREFCIYLQKLIIKRVKEVVRRQIYNWSPLSKTWSAFKKSYGLNPRIWYASGFMMNHIKYWHNKTYDTYFVGVHPRQRHRKYSKKGGVYKTKITKTLLLTIIKSLEYGTQTIPARPLFTKVFREFKKDYVLHYNNFLTKKGYAVN